MIMSIQRYICIAESRYEDKASWLDWGMEFMSTGSLQRGLEICRGLP